MARSLKGRITVAGKLKLIDPLHVGSGKETYETDMAVAVDGEGKVYAPGTSLAGALRHWCESRFPNDEELIQFVWGHQKVKPEKMDHQKDDEGAAAYLHVEDARLCSSNETRWEIRDHVGIDREHGVAAGGIKFDRAVVPPGESLIFHLTLDLHDVQKAEDKARKAESDPHTSKDKKKKLRDFADKVKRCVPSVPAVLGHLLEALQNEELRLGAGKTRGLGRVKLEDVSIKKHSWDRDGLLARLGGNSKTTSIDDLKQRSRSDTRFRSPCESHDRLGSRFTNDGEIERGRSFCRYASLIGR